EAEIVAQMEVRLDRLGISFQIVGQGGDNFWGHGRVAHAATSLTEFWLADRSGSITLDDDGSVVAAETKRIEQRCLDFPFLHRGTETPRLDRRVRLPQLCV